MKGAPKPAKSRIPEIVLTVVIIGALGFIAAKFLRKSSSLETASQPVEVSAPIAPIVNSGNVFGDAKKAPFGQRPQAIFAKQPKLDEAAWKSWLSSYKLSGVDKTKKCADAKASEEGLDGTYQVLSKALRDRLIENGGGVVARFGGRRCHRVGQTLQFVYFGESSDEPYVSDLGGFLVDAIVEFDRKKMPPQFWQVLGLEPLDVASISNPFSETTLLNVSKVKGSTGAGKQVPEHFRYPRLRDSDLTDSQFKKAVSADAVKVIDIRSTAKRDASPIPASTNFEYIVRDSAGAEVKEFRWDLRVRDLEKAVIPADKVFEASTRPNGAPTLVIVVGDGASDARPFWLLRDLSGLEVPNARWYVGDPGKLAEALK